MKLRNWYYASVIAALLTASLLFAAAAPAEISYRVQALPESKQVAVEVSIPNATAETVVQIPRWMPGFLWPPRLWQKHQGLCRHWRRQQSRHG